MVATWYFGIDFMFLIGSMCSGLWFILLSFKCNACFSGSSISWSLQRSTQFDNILKVENIEMLGVCVCARVCVCVCVVCACVWFLLGRDSWCFSFFFPFFYGSLWPESINTKVKGQQLGSNDSIQMMFVQVCVCNAYACVCVYTCVCVCAYMYKRKTSISKFTESTCLRVCRVCVSVCVCVCVYSCSSSCVSLQPLSWGVDDLWSALWFHRGQI